MTAVRPQRLDVKPPIDEAEDVDDELDADGTDAAEDDNTDDEAPELVAEESGIDLTDASELDADNVPADEEHDRVVHAPD
jgi:hypothetical protein